ncbi:MAG: hypothetical protein ACRELG_05495 [Gemmataceae bacterium]
MKARLKLKMQEVAPEVRQPAGVDLHALGVRWRAGEKISVLAREAGMTWNKLWSDLEKLGYRPRPSDNSDPQTDGEPANNYVPGGGWRVV